MDAGEGALRETHRTGPCALALAHRFPCVSSRLLIKTDHVSRWVAKPCRDLGRVDANRLHHLAPVRDDRVNSPSHAVHHDVNQKSGRGGRRAVEHPAAAHLAGRVVKRSATVIAFPDVPAEDTLVELSRARNIRGGKLDVADLTIRKRPRYKWQLRFRSTDDELRLNAREAARLTGLALFIARRNSEAVPRPDACPGPPRGTKGSHRKQRLLRISNRKNFAVSRFDRLVRENSLCEFLFAEAAVRRRGGSTSQPLFTRRYIMGQFHFSAPAALRYAASRHRRTR
jgi:hypothetical protein